MDEHHEGEAPAGPSSAVRSRFWAGLNHASGHATEGPEPDVGAADPGGAGPAAQESSAPRGQGT